MSEAVSERPTMSQAFAADVAPATESLPVSTPTTDATPAASASADTIAPPADAPPPTDHASPEADGPIPLDRHKKILDGIYKERDDARQQLDSWKAYEWAKQVPKAEFDAMAGWYAKAQANPVEFALNLVEELSADQQHAAVLRSQAGRMLRAARSGQPEAQAQAPVDMTPDIPVHDEQGRLVAQTYSADRVKQLLQQQKADLEALVQPLKQDADQRRQTEQQAEAQRQQQAYVASESTRIKSAVQKLPHAMEHWSAIVEKARTYPEDIPIGEVLRDAYFEIVGPRLSATAKTEVLETLQTKAAATSVNPTGAVVASTARPKSLLDKSLTW